MHRSMFMNNMVYITYYSTLYVAIFATICKYRGVLQRKLFRNTSMLI